MMQNQRVTIGFFTNTISDQVQTPLWAGIQQAARKYNVNLLCIAGRQLNSPHGFEAQGNLLYQLVNEHSFDGLIIWASVLSHFINYKAMTDFCQRYHPLPMVTLGLEIPGIPNIDVENKTVLQAMFNHLLADHGYKRLALLNAPEKLARSQEWYQAYSQALGQFQLAVDPALIVSGDMAWLAGRQAGRDAINTLLDERQVGFDAIIAATDNMALGAIEALQQRGIRVPYDVGVVGYDDIEEGHYITPPLTTISTNMVGRGQKSVELILDQLHGKSVPQKTILSPQLIIRQSCSCFSETVRQAAIMDSAVLNSSSSPNPKIVKTALQQSLHIYKSKTALFLPVEWPTTLVDSLLEAIVHNRSQKFLVVLNTYLQQTLFANEDVDLWHIILLALQRALWSNFDTAKSTANVENLWHQARALVSETMQRQQAHQHYKTIQQANILQDLFQNLGSLFNLDGMTQLLSNKLPQLGVRQGYLVLYDQPAPPVNTIRLVMAFNEQGQMPLSSENQSRPAAKLIPIEFLANKRRYHLIIEPLFFRDVSFGFLALEIDQPADLMCEALRDQVSSALHAAKLMEQVQNQANYLKTEVAVRTSELQQEISEREHFQEQLTMLHAVNTLLSKTTTIADLCRQAIDLGRSHLGFDRLGIWFLDDDPQYIRGAFGVDEHGNLRDERGQRVLIEPTEEFQVILSGNPPVKFKVDTFLHDDRHQVAGKGWVAMAAIWDGDKTLGLLNADNLLKQNPPTHYQFELLRLYGITLGNLITRQQAEAGLQRYSEQLQEMVKARTVALEEAQEQLVRQEKLAFLGQLAGGVGHELRNPLGVINNALYYLNMTLSDADESVTEYLGIIAERVAEADKIVGDLLNLSRNRIADREKVDPYALIGEVFTRHQVPDGVVIETLLPSGLPPLFVDGQQIQQVLGNLVTNAYQAMPHGGTLTITAELKNIEIKAQDFEAESAKTIMPALELTVVDTGLGISDQVISKIFEPLFTTKVKGIGLGLAISKKLVEANRGSIKVESIKGTGTTFTLLLPAAL